MATTSVRPEVGNAPRSRPWRASWLLSSTAIPLLAACAAGAPPLEALDLRDPLTAFWRAALCDAARGDRRALVLGNPSIPSGGVLELAALFRIPLDSNRFEIGLETRGFRSSVAAHYALGLSPLSLAVLTSRPIGIMTTYEPRA